ncbi:hypothetical protein [Sulfoacidibacillus thermotolerans]|uniref:Uncharacterized protein n=1 Tax=Sulfoacidibacillus thermotolerans TaxID=1765684 RepID=A0A2U3DAS6_SULT2|nr:hypothetical protein [Sulfoacidibacillus thermotolerans]PWI58379.1 hypothetical protein BM613_03950 [Sulfoacidibacillus thermotolerans]
MAVLQAIFIRVAIGFSIAAVGTLVSLVTGNWRIEYDWFGMLGMILLGAASIPLFTTSSRKYISTQRKIAKEPLHDAVQIQNGNEIHLAVTLFLIGAINFLVPIIIYYGFHPK